MIYNINNTNHLHNGHEAQYPKPIEISETEAVLYNNNLVSSLMMTPIHIRSNRDKEALIHMVGEDITKILLVDI